MFRESVKITLIWRLNYRRMQFKLIRVTSDVFYVNDKDIQYVGDLQRNYQGRKNEKNLAKIRLEYLWQETLTPKDG